MAGNKIFSFTGSDGSAASAARAAASSASGVRGAESAGTGGSSAVPREEDLFPQVHALSTLSDFSPPPRTPGGGGGGGESTPISRGPVDGADEASAPTTPANGNAMASPALSEGGSNILTPLSGAPPSPPGWDSPSDAANSSTKAPMQRPHAAAPLLGEPLSPLATAGASSAPQSPSRPAGSTDTASGSAASKGSGSLRERFGSSPAQLLRRAASKIRSHTAISGSSHLPKPAKGFRMLLGHTTPEGKGIAAPRAPANTPSTPAAAPADDPANAPAAAAPPAATPTEEAPAAAAEPADVTEQPAAAAAGPAELAPVLSPAAAAGAGADAPAATFAPLPASDGGAPDVGRSRGDQSPTPSPPQGRKQQRAAAAAAAPPSPAESHESAVSFGSRCTPAPPGAVPFGSPQSASTPSRTLDFAAASPSILHRAASPALLPATPEPAADVAGAAAGGGSVAGAGEAVGEAAATAEEAAAAEGPAAAEEPASPAEGNGSVVTGPPVSLDELFASLQDSATKRRAKTILGESEDGGDEAAAIPAAEETAVPEAAAADEAATAAAVAGLAGDGAAAAGWSEEGEDQEPEGMLPAEAAAPAAVAVPAPALAAEANAAVAKADAAHSRERRHRRTVWPLVLGVVLAALAASAALLTVQGPPRAPPPVCLRGAAAPASDCAADYARFFEAATAVDGRNGPVPAWRAALVYSQWTVAEVRGYLDLMNAAVQKAPAVATTLVPADAPAPGEALRGSLGQQHPPQRQQQQQQQEEEADLPTPSISHVSEQQPAAAAATAEPVPGVAPAAEPASRWSRLSAAKKPVPRWRPVKHADACPAWTALSPVSFPDCRVAVVSTASGLTGSLTDAAFAAYELRSGGCAAPSLPPVPRDTCIAGSSLLGRRPAASRKLLDFTSPAALGAAAAAALATVAVIGVLARGIAGRGAPPAADGAADGMAPANGGAVAAAANAAAAAALAVGSRVLTPRLKAPRPPSAIGYDIDADEAAEAAASDFDAPADLPAPRSAARRAASGAAAAAAAAASRRRRSAPVQPYVSEELSGDAAGVAAPPAARRSRWLSAAAPDALEAAPEATAAAAPAAPAARSGRGRRASMAAVQEEAPAAAAPARRSGRARGE